MALMPDSFHLRPLSVWHPDLGEFSCRKRWWYQQVGKLETPDYRELSWRGRILFTREVDVLKARAIEVSEEPMVRIPKAEYDELKRRVSTLSGALNSPLTSAAQYAHHVASVAAQPSRIPTAREMQLMADAQAAKIQSEFMGRLTVAAPPPLR
jgi:hypothetical protein